MWHEIQLTDINTDASMDDIREWCVTQFGPPYIKNPLESYKTSSWQVFMKMDPEDFTSILVGRFVDESAALLFKLTWE